MSKKNAPLFKGLQLSWWQVGVFKLSTISFGVLLAFYFRSFFVPYITVFWITCIVSGVYIAYIYLKK